MSKDNDNELLLITAEDTMQCSLIEEILKDNSIVYIKKERASGGYMKILSGYSLYGTDFYVSSEQYDEANGLMEAYFGEDAELIYDDDFDDVLDDVLEDD